MILDFYRFKFPSYKKIKIVDNNKLFEVIKIEKMNLKILKIKFYS